MTLLPAPYMLLLIARPNFVFAAYDKLSASKADCVDGDCCECAAVRCGCPC